MNISQNRFLAIILRWGLASVFIYAGAIKLVAPQNFSDSIAAFDILPNRLINVTALSLPPFEIISGLVVLIGIQCRSALIGIVALTIIFIFAAASAILRGIPIDCGCFGSGKASVLDAWMTLGRDILILAVALTLAARMSANRDAA